MMKVKAPAMFAIALSAMLSLIVGAVVVPASPASADSSDRIIWSTYNGNCLDQHYRDGEPTTTVYAWGDCHRQNNQRWWLEDKGNGTFKIRNLASKWCLSAPENSGSKVFAEHCVDGARKQLWGRSVSVYGFYVLAVQRPGASCMYMHTATELRVVPNKIPSECRGDLSTYNWGMHLA